MPDRQIARRLNRSGKSTGYGNGWSEQPCGEITLDAAAHIIGVAKMPALRMIRRADLKEPINRSGNTKSGAADP